MVTIYPTRLHWIRDDGEDDPLDYCAHSPVEMVLNGKKLVSSEHGDWAVSASAIILLRSLFRDHIGSMQDEEHVFPCCGQGMRPKDGGGVQIWGCPNGIDFSIFRVEDKFNVKFSGDLYEVDFECWREAVLIFGRIVRRFYSDSLPKDISPESEPDGYIAMISELDKLMQRAEQVVPPKSDRAGG